MSLGQNESRVVVVACYGIGARASERERARESERERAREREREVCTRQVCASVVRMGTERWRERKRERERARAREQSSERARERESEREKLFIWKQRACV